MKRLNEKKENLISVIIPVYKVEEFLKRCVDSVLQQTYKNLEIILVDDGSPDRCPKMCDDFANFDKRIKVVHKKNGGLMAAWIDGVKIAVGEYVAFVDSDDWVEPTFIEDLYEPYRRIKDLDLSICQYFRSTDEYKVQLKATKHNLLGLLTGSELEKCKNNNIQEFYYYRWNKLFKKETILKNLQFCDTRINLWEDVCISMAAIFEAKKIFISEKYLYNYYDRPTSIVNVYKKDMLKNFEYFYPKFIEVLKQKEYMTNKNVIDHITRILFIVSKNIILSDAKNKRKMFKDLYKSIFWIEAKKYKGSQMVGANKLFLCLFKTKSYCLVSMAIKILTKIKQ